MQALKCDRKLVLTFCTNNPSKLEDALRLLGASAQEAHDAFPFSIESLDCALDLPELQGDPLFVAEQKCLAAARQLNKPVFVEDTSLCMDALKGLPGPYIKEFLKNCGPEGLSKLLTAFEDKGACAQSIVVFCGGSKQTMHCFVGKTRGNIVYPRGKINPYKIDSIFEPVEGDGRTFAEMEAVERDLLSHRSRAFSKFREFLNHCR
jgi:inosine triphosphate pyrophosphatase